MESKKTEGKFELGKWTGGPVGLAQFSTFKIDTTPGNALVIEYDFPWGRGDSSNKDSALVRPFRKILRDGKDPGKINYLFHTDNDKYYVLGSFAYTNNHIIFFPAFVDRTIVNFYETQFIEQGIQLHVDHFTLENNLRTWHVTFDEKQEQKTRVRKLNTKNIDEYNFLWFILRIKSLSAIEFAPQRQIMLLESTKSEVIRRAPIINKARENAVFQATKLDDNLTEEYFWQFEFFVNTTQDRKNIPKVPVTVQGNIDADIKDARKQAHIRIHQVFLDGFNGCIIIRVSKIIGTIKTPIQFISGHEIQYTTPS
ncbi:MAG: hypothetical protein WD033_02340 [Nitrosopumilaceae archaeon]